MQYMLFELDNAGLVLNIFFKSFHSFWERLYHKTLPIHSQDKACLITGETPVIRQALSWRHTSGALSADQPGQPQGNQDDESIGGVDPERLDLRKD